MINIKIFEFNPFQENTYVLYDETKECVIIDAGAFFEEEKQMLKSFIEENKLKPIKLLNTHCHVDHLLGNSFVCKEYNVQSWANELEETLPDFLKERAAMYGFELDDPPEVKNNIKDGDSITFGNSELKALHVPGHSRGSIAFYSEPDKFVITGDALFQGSIGRTDLSGGDYNTLIESIKNKLFTLDGETKVYPGHGGSSTIGEEKQTNPFFQ